LKKESQFWVILFYNNWLYKKKELSGASGQPFFGMVRLEDHTHITANINSQIIHLISRLLRSFGFKNPSVLAKA
jgi:hypothetical protein